MVSIAQGGLTVTDGCYRYCKLNSGPLDKSTIQNNRYTILFQILFILVLCVHSFLSYFLPSLTFPNLTLCSCSCLKQTILSVYKSKTKPWSPIYAGNMWAQGLSWGVFAIPSVTLMRKLFSLSKQLSITNNYLASCRALWPLPLLHAWILSGLSCCRSCE